MLALLPLAAVGALAMSPPSAIVRSELVDERAPYASAHASTIVQTPDGLVAAWFAGTGEGK